MASSDVTIIPRTILGLFQPTRVAAGCRYAKKEISMTTFFRISVVSHPHIIFFVPFHLYYHVSAQTPSILRPPLPAWFVPTQHRPHHPFAPPSASRISSAPVLVHSIQLPPSPPPRRCPHPRPAGASPLLPTTTTPAPSPGPSPPPPPP